MFHLMAIIIHHKDLFIFYIFSKTLKFFFLHCEARYVHTFAQGVGCLLKKIILMAKSAFENFLDQYI